MGVVFSHKEGNDHKLSQAILWNINKVGVAIVHALPETVYIPSYQSKALCGRFTELSLQTTNFDEDLEKWIQLGFHVISSRYESIQKLINNGLEPAFIINDGHGNVMNAGVMAPEGTGFFLLES